MYGSWVLVMGETIYAKDGEKFTEKLCPTKGPWFEKLMRGLKLRMGLIKKQDFGVIIKMINAILRGLDTDWKGGRINLEKRYILQGYCCGNCFIRKGSFSCLSGGNIRLLEEMNI